MSDKQAEIKEIFHGLQTIFQDLQMRMEQLEKCVLEVNAKVDKVILSEDNANRKGPKYKLTDQDILWLKQQRAIGRSIADMARELAVTRQTVYNYIQKDYAQEAKDRKTIKDTQ